MNYVLLRKEIRQLNPLAIAVLVLGSLCFTLYLMQPANWQLRSFAPGFILLAIPALFAVGAGAMSVSQEKETKTLTWLSSLPLASRHLILAKFLAASIFIVHLWLGAMIAIFASQSVLAIDIFNSHDRGSHPIYSAWLVYYILNSAYLLVCGFLTAWRFGSSMSALTAFIPLALAPSVTRFLVAYVQDPFKPINSPSYDHKLSDSLIVVVVLLCVASWWMIRFATKSLAPQQTSLKPNPYESSAIPFDRSIQTSDSVLRPTTALLWQFFAQNRTAYLSLVGISLFGGLLAFVVADTYSYKRFSWEAVSICVVLLMTAWMGVLVFQGDNLQERIRFLSERGIAPGHAWLTRQIFPLSFCCAVAFVYAVIASRYLRFNPDDLPLPMWLAFWGLIVVFAYSQWFAQLVRNPVLGAIGGPVASLAAIFYIIYAHEDLSDRIIFTFVITIAPFVATFLLMRHWMDRRFNRIFWLGHVVILLLAVLGPIADFVWYIQTAPSMPNDVRQALLTEQKSIAARPWQTHYVSLERLSRVHEYGFGELSIDQKLENDIALNDIATIHQKLNDELKVRSGPGIGMELPRGELFHFIGTTILSRKQLDRGDESTALEDYVDRLKLLSTIATHLRQSVDLLSQEHADIAEIALIAELQQPNAKERIPSEVWDDIVTQVADQKLRTESRRRAVIASWYENHRSKREYIHHNSLGGYSLYNHSVWSYTRHDRTYLGRIDHLAWILIRMLEAGPSASEQEILEVLRMRLPYDSNLRTQVTSVVPNRVDDPSRFDFKPAGAIIPGDQWFAGWEDIGASLAIDPKAQ